MTTTEPHPAYAHACPFCGAKPQQPCRKHRGVGGPVEWPHSRRLQLVSAFEPSPPLPALCCDCGHVRRVHIDYHRRDDPNYSGPSDFTHPHGWRETLTLKCDACRSLTRHARLQVNHDDLAAVKQEIALGGQIRPGWSASTQDRIKIEYRQMPFPRNPKLHHWHYVKEVEEALARGDTHMAAVCGDQTPTPRGNWRESDLKKTYDPVRPDRTDWATEFEDHDTGMWWVDMDCVNCLRVINDQRLAVRRDYLNRILRWLAVNPDAIPDAHVAETIEHLDRLRTHQPSAGAE